MGSLAGRHLRYVVYTRKHLISGVECADLAIARDFAQTEANQGDDEAVVMERVNAEVDGAEGDWAWDEKEVYRPEVKAS